MPDKVPVERQPGYTRALQGGPDAVVGSSSLSRVSRSVGRDTAKIPVSNYVPDGTKLQ